jgi:hypothetical protein
VKTNLVALLRRGYVGTKYLTVAQLQRLDFFGELAFHGLASLGGVT